MELSFSLGQKEGGGVSLYRWLKPASVTLGQQFKLGLVVNDLNGVAVTLTTYTILIRLRNADDSILEVTGTAVDNVKGEVEFEITSAQSELLKTGSNQTIEIELRKTATPTTKTFGKVEKAITIVSQAIT